MPEIRTFRLDDGNSVVALRGELGYAAAAEVVAEVANLHDGAVIVDLLRAHLDDDRVLAAFVDVDASFVAERPLLDALELVAPRTFATLAAALA